MRLIGRLDSVLTVKICRIAVTPLAPVFPSNSLMGRHRNTSLTELG